MKRTPRITSRFVPAIAALAIIASAMPANADLIPATYSLVGTGTVVDATDTTLTLDAAAMGSVLSGNAGLDTAWNPVTYSDESVLDLNTGLLNGTFTFSFVDGATLSGNVFEDNTAVLASPTQTGPFTQTLTFTGGTGEFTGATGSFSGGGFVGLTEFTVSGSGTITTSAVPEPSSIMLLLSGLALIIMAAQRYRSLSPRLSQPTLPIALALTFFTVSASADSVYVINGNGQFGAINLETGSFQQIGSDLIEPGTGLVSGPNGSLLTLGVGGNLDAINPATGVMSVIGPTGLADCSTPASPCGPNSANTITRLGANWYATDFANNLYTVDPSTGRAALIGSTGIPAVPFVPFSENPDGTLNFFGEAFFSANGTLYATFDTGTLNPESGAITPTTANHLYQIDPRTGKATVIAATAFALDTVVGINGTFYAFKNDTAQIVDLNLANGGTSLVTNFAPAAGLVFGASPVPEPVSIMLALVGIAALGSCRWLRNRADR